MIQKKTLRLVVFFLLIWCTSLPLGSPPHASGQTNKNVLVLNSYHKGFPWTDNIVKGIESILSSDLTNNKLVVEYMDTKAMGFGNDYKQKLYELLKFKYKDQHFDLIISSDDNAFNLLREFGEELFPGVPIVVCGVNNRKAPEIVDPTKITGVLESTSHKETIELILKLHPATRKIYLVIDKTPSGKYRWRVTEPSFSFFKDIEFIRLSDDYSISEIEETVGKLDEDSAVIFFTLYRDSSGKYLTLKESASRVTNASARPVYTTHLLELPYGVVGGKVLGGFYHGETVAKIGMRILNGEKVENIPFLFKSPTQYVFDHGQLEKWNINHSDLPEESIILNEPFSVYETYKGYIWLTLLIILSLIGVIFVLQANNLKRKLAERALLKSEKEYRDLIQMAQEGIWVIDKENRTTFANSSMAKMLGYEVDEILDKDLFEFMDEEGKNLALENIERRKQGIKEQHDFEFLTKQGNRIYTTMETAPIIDDEGEYSGAIAGVVNITDRRIKERIQEAQFNLIRYSSSHTSKELLIRFLDETEKLTESTIGFYHFYDNDRKQLSLSSWSTNTSQNICQSDQFEHHYPLEKAGVWADAVRERKPIIHNDYKNLQYKNGYPEGHVAIIRELVVPVIRDDKIVAVLGIGNKSSDYNEFDVRIVQELANLAWETVSKKLTEELLVENEKLLRIIGENYPHSYILIVEKDFSISFILGQEVDNLNINPGVYKGELIDDLYGHYTDFVKDKYTRVFAGENQAFELLIDNRNYYFSSVPIKPENGVIERILVVVENITEKRQLEIKLNQSHKMEAIGTLAGGIAHDFNNILSSILGFTELALDGVKEDTDIEDDLQEVLVASKRAKELVKQILTFARQSEVQVKPLQLKDTVNEVLKLIRSTVPSTIEIKERIDSNSFVMGSETHIHQLLMNLCTNAYQSMEKKGGVLEISLSDVSVDLHHSIADLAPGEYIELKVSDTGEGIDPQHTQAIFDPYFTTKSPGKGTGMGLAVAHGIVESAQGKIIVESSLGIGTTLTVYLPITKKPKVNIEHRPEELPAGNENILIVDDEVALVKMGKKALSQLGYSITTRTSSLEALELFKLKPFAFDLVITDMTMPNMTGDDLTKELIKIRPDIPVILYTGYSNKITEYNANEIGIKAFVYKPIVKSELAKTVRKVLNEAQRQATRSD